MFRCIASTSATRSSTVLSLPSPAVTFVKASPLRVERHQRKVVFEIPVRLGKNTSQNAGKRQNGWPHVESITFGR